MTKQLIKNWEIATQAIADEFVRKYYGDDVSEMFWVGDEIGDVLVVNDQFWNVNNMLEAFKYKCSKKRLFEWWDLLVAAGMEGRPCQNLRTYAKWGNLNKGKKC